MWRTEEDSQATQQSVAPPRPGLVVVWSGRAPALRAFEIDGDGVIIGRDLVASLGPFEDDRISRQHARIRCAGGALVACDLGSRNGTYLAGRRLDAEAWVHAPAVIRTGRTIALLVPDV